MAISPKDRAKLVALARDAVEASVKGRSAPKVTNPKGILAEQRGCFVTLTNEGRLRGCIGTFSPRGALAEMIVSMGASAAHDPRFTVDPFTPAELVELSVEVSVLSPLAKTTTPEKLQVGVHGIYVTNGQRAGCFLPEVATDQGWNATQFLSYCCAHKAGLPPDAWRMLDTKVYLFTSEKFDH